MYFHNYILLCLLCCVLRRVLFSYKNGHKNTNHSKLNDNSCVSSFVSNTFRQLQIRSRSRNLAPSKVKLLVTIHKEVAVVLKYTFTDVAGLLDLSLYKCKSEVAVKVSWDIPYWLVFITRFRRSAHWPVFKIGLGRMMNSWSIKAGNINPEAAIKRILLNKCFSNLINHK